MRYFLIKLISFFIPTDFFAKKYPVSVKGIVSIGEKIVLLKNDRNEWELPGGKLDPEESVEACAIREIQEELSIKASIDRLIDIWVYDIQGKVKVIIITYGCILEPGQTEKDLKLSHEHKDLGLFTLDEIPGLNMPQGYKDSIAKYL